MQFKEYLVVFQMKTTIFYCKLLLGILMNLSKLIIEVWNTHFHEFSNRYKKSEYYKYSIQVNLNIPKVIIWINALIKIGEMIMLGVSLCTYRLYVDQQINLFFSLNEYKRFLNEHCVHLSLAFTYNLCLLFIITNY